MVDLSKNRTGQFFKDYRKKVNFCGEPKKAMILGVSVTDLERSKALISMANVLDLHNYYMEQGLDVVQRPTNSGPTKRGPWSTGSST